MRRTGAELCNIDYYLPPLSPRNKGSIPLTTGWWALPEHIEKNLRAWFRIIGTAYDERFAIAGALDMLTMASNCAELAYTEPWAINQMAFFMHLVRLGFIKHHILLSPAVAHSFFRRRHAPAVADADGERWVVGNADCIRFEAWKPFWV